MEEDLFLPWPEVSVSLLLHPSLHHDGGFFQFLGVLKFSLEVVFCKQYELLRQLLHSSVVIGVDITI